MKATWKGKKMYIFGKEIYVQKGNGEITVNRKQWIPVDLKRSTWISLCYCCCLQTYISWLDEWNRRKLKKNNNNLCRMVIHPKRHLLQWRFCLNQNKIILKKLIFDLCGFWLPWRWFIRKRNDSDLVFLSLKSFKD